VKAALIPLILLSLLQLRDHAAAQQHYSFEDACKMAGRTTGPCAPKSEQEETLDCSKIAGNAFHPEKIPGGQCKLKLSPVLDIEVFVEMIGLPNIAKINGLKLTIAHFEGYEGAVAAFYNGLPIIVLDPQWARSGTAETYLILGHEAGHHFCGHPLDADPIAQKKRELEADRFSGAAIKRFEEYHGKPFLEAALKAATRLYAGHESGSHPSQEARLEAVKLGYNSGSPCGNLSPGIRGYTAGPR
jgi:hypothetical protein